MCTRNLLLFIYMYVIPIQRKKFVYLKLKVVHFHADYLSYQSLLWQSNLPFVQKNNSFYQDVVVM